MADIKITHGHLDVIAQLSDSAIRDSIRELQSRDRLTLGLREALRNGMSIDDLSARSGLTPADIRDRIRRPLIVLSELDALAGVA